MMLKEIPNLANNIKAKEKLELLYQLYVTRLLYTAKGILKNSYDAEGVVQSAFIKVMYILDEIENPEEKRTYALLTTIVKNLCYDHIRKRKYEELVDFDGVQWDMADTRSPEQICVEKEEESEFRDFIQAMPEKYRAPMLLHYVHELSVKEVAEVLGITQNLASVRLSRGRKYMLDVIEKSGNMVNEIS